MITKEQLRELGWSEELAAEVVSAIEGVSEDVLTVRDAIEQAGGQEAPLNTDGFNVIGAGRGSTFCLIR